MARLGSRGGAAVCQSPLLIMNPLSGRHNLPQVVA